MMKNVAAALVGVIVSSGLLSGCSASHDHAAMAQGHLAVAHEESAVVEEGQGRDLAAVRAATSQYHDIANAQAAGYKEVPGCDTTPNGSMGIHYLKPPMPSTVPAITEPTVLLYEPTENGRMRLVGVEYMVIDKDGSTDTDSDRPSLFGVDFDGPMLGHTSGMPVHYDLHVWVWKHNPSGMFAQHNPDVRC